MGLPRYLSIFRGEIEGHWSGSPSKCRGIKGHWRRSKTYNTAILWPGWLMRLHFRVHFNGLPKKGIKEVNSNGIPHVFTYTYQVFGLALLKLQYMKSWLRYKGWCSIWLILFLLFLDFFGVLNLSFCLIYKCSTGPVGGGPNFDFWYRSCGQSRITLSQSVVHLNNL